MAEGSCEITTVASEDSYYESASDTISISVSKASTSLVLSASIIDAKQGEVVTYTASLEVAGAEPDFQSKPMSMKPAQENQNANSKADGRGWMVGPSVKRNMKIEDKQVETMFGVSGVYNFGMSGAGASSSLGEDSLRARFDAGLSVVGLDGKTIQLSG